MAKFQGYTACPRCRSNGKDRRGDNLALYSDGGGHCFSCHYNKPPTHYAPPIKVDHEPAAKAVLPSDFTREVPGIAWKWLLQYGLSYNYWQPFVGWSETHRSLIFPQGDFSIGRYFGDDPKNRRKWHVYGNDKARPLVFGKAVGGEVVLVEDLISAHKVAQVTQAIPLFGSDVYDALVPVLRHLGTPIVMWLDKDQEQHARKRATRLSVLTGLPVRYVFTKDDPKALAINQIKDTLSNDYETKSST